MGKLSILFDGIALGGTLVCAIVGFIVDEPNIYLVSIGLFAVMIPLTINDWRKS